MNKGSGWPQKTGSGSETLLTTVLKKVCHFNKIGTCVPSYINQSYLEIAELKLKNVKITSTLKCFCLILTNLDYRKLTTMLKQVNFNLTSQSNLLTIYQSIIRPCSLPCHVFSACLPGCMNASWWRRTNFLNDNRNSAQTCTVLTFRTDVLIVLKPPYTMKQIFRNRNPFLGRNSVNTRQDRDPNLHLCRCHCVGGRGGE